MSDTPTPQDVSGADRALMRRAVTASMIGNATEWYDYAIYGYLATVIGQVFFPSEEETVSLAASFATFAVAFVIRPAGAFFFGPLNDKIGRKRTLSITILVMAAATCAIGVLPSYATGGVLAPILLLLARLIQGFAVGGEYGGASTFVVECAPDRRRGFWASWLECGAIGGFLLASGLVTGLTFALSEDAMQTWGWRVPFLLALPLGSIGLYLRLKLVDTPSFRTMEDRASLARAPVRETFARHGIRIFVCAGIMMYSSVGTYVILTYMPSYFTETLKMSSADSQLLVFIAGGVLVAAIPFAGILSDRIGRKAMLLAAAAGFTVTAYPAFLLISTGDWYAALAGLLLLTLCQILILGTTTATLPALFPTRVRGTGVAVGYNISFAIFGGTAPLLLTYLVDATGNSFVPAFYLIVIALAAIVPILLGPETARRPLLGEITTAPVAG